MKKQKAAFLDRDGVINLDSGYVHKASELTFIEGVFDACRVLQEAGYLIVVVTNQSGVARGFYTELDVIILHDWMAQQFKAHNVNISRFYFSPYHKDQGQGEYRRDSQCRKPNPGMLLQAAQDLDIELSASLMIGDRESDVLAGQNAGVAKTVKILSEHKLSNTVADFTCASLKEFTDRFLPEVMLGQ